MKVIRLACASVLGATCAVLGVGGQAVGAEGSSRDQVPSYTAEYVDAEGDVTLFDLSDGVPEGVEGVPVPLAAAPTGITWQTWGACGVSTPSTKLVRAFSAGHAPMPALYLRTVNLLCGNASYGFRHIEAKHGSQWVTASSWVGATMNWRYFADWAIAQSLQSPTRWCRDAGRNTLNYLGLIQIRDTSGKVVKIYYPRVVTGQNTSRVVTAFPQTLASAGC